MLGEVAGCDEGQYVRLEAFEVFVVEDFDRGVFDTSVHSLCLAVGPWMIRAWSTGARSPVRCRRDRRCAGGGNAGWGLRDSWADRRRPYGMAICNPYRHG